MFCIFFPETQLEQSPRNLNNNKLAPRQRIPPSHLHLLQNPVKVIGQAGPDGGDDLFRDGTVEGLDDAARDAGERVAVAAGRDGLADGGVVSLMPALARRGFRSLTAFAAEWCAAEGVQREKMGGGENLAVAGNITAAAHLFPPFPVRDAPFRKTRSVERSLLRKVTKIRNQLQRKKSLQNLNF